MFRKIKNKILNSVPEIQNPKIENQIAQNPTEMKGEELAAITMGLHLYLNAYRDEESEVITIDMPSARYSPWALKSLVMKRVVRR